MNILVTGSCGQLGSEIKNSQLKSVNNYIFTDVVNIDKSKIYYLDITSFECIKKIIRDNQINVIVNCASYTDVDRAESDKKESFLINSYAVEYLAKAIKEVDGTLIHISTDYVFDGQKNEPYMTNEIPAPINVYGDSKLGGENAIKESGCKYIIIRTSWLYSLYGNNFVKKIHNLACHHDSIKVVIDEIGSPTSAHDLASFIVNLIDKNELDKLGIYNYSNEGIVSRYDFAKAIVKYFNDNCVVNYCYSSDFPTIADRPKYSVLDKTKTVKTFDVSIPYWIDSLCQFIDTFKEHYNAKI